MGAPTLNPEQVNGLLRSPDTEVRTKLAAHRGAPGDILCQLAQDPAPEVRRAVAANPSTPRDADIPLSHDDDVMVRCNLAARFAQGALDDDDYGKLWRVGFTILETLACDQEVQVRSALALSLGTATAAPAQIMVGLAHDPDAGVAAPILQHSPVLRSQDLKGIIESASDDWAAEAIAKRQSVDPEVAEAIVAGGSVTGMTALIQNHGAEIGAQTMSDLVDRAPNIRRWHEPLVDRPGLPDNIIVRLARFVSPKLLVRLRKRKGLSPKVMNIIDQVARARVELSKRKSTRTAAYGIGPEDGGTRDNDVSWETPEERARRLFAQHKLDDSTIVRAVVGEERDFVIACLAMRAGLPVATVVRILSSASAKAVTALCWKGGLKMPVASVIQEQLAKIPADSVLRGGDGPTYPLMTHEMEHQIELFMQ